MTKEQMIADVSQPMKGTGGDPDYVTVGVFQAGKVGFKQLGAEGVRVRVEPTAKGDTLPFPSNWTRPGKGENQNRYSLVVPNGINFIAAMTLAVGILAAASLEE
jgi:hypothetical protein